jgi:osmotically-inducible protein OsmY
MCRVLLLVLATLGTIPPVLARDPASEQRQADARQKLHVRRVFEEDAALAPYTCDIWVEVHGTLVLLSGKVPSAPLKQRALFLAGQIKGVAEAQGDELLVDSPDGISDLPSPFVEGLPPRSLLAGQHKDDRGTTAPQKAEISEVRPAGSVPAVALEAPVPLTPRPAAAPLRPAVVILPPRPLPEAGDLSSLAKALCRKDERFGRVTVEVRQGTVSLRGSVPRWEDLTELANAVRRLPGVTAVILDNVHVDRAALR